MRRRFILPKSHILAWAQQCIDPGTVGAISLDNVRLKYQVFGRRTDGSLIDRKRIWWLVRRSSVWNADGSDHPKVIDDNLVWPDGSAIQLKSSTT